MVVQLGRRLFGSGKHKWEVIETRPTSHLPIVTSVCEWCGFIREKEGLNTRSFSGLLYASAEAPTEFHTGRYWESRVNYCRPKVEQRCER